MKNLVFLAAGIVLLFSVCSGVNAQTISDDEYMNAYFVIYSDYLAGEGKFSKDELLDVIEYYLTHEDLSGKLNSLGSNSNQMIGTILADAGVGFDCGACDSSLLGIRCCIYRIGEVPMAYECVGTEVMGVKSYSWKELWQCTYGCCANKCCLSPEGGTTTTTSTTTTTGGSTTTSTTSTTTTTIGDFCQSDKDCILAYGACWICPVRGGNCSKGDKNCERDDTCTDTYGPNWKCVSPGCCAPVTTTTTTTSTTTTTGGTTTTPGGSTTTSTTSTTTTSIGDFCQSDKDCILAYGACWICPVKSGNCAKDGKNCDTDKQCTDVYGPGWRCSTPTGCCAPVTTTTTTTSTSSTTSSSSTSTSSSTTSTGETTTTSTSSTTTTVSALTCTDILGGEINVGECSKDVDGMRCLEDNGKASLQPDSSCTVGPIPTTGGPIPTTGGPSPPTTGGPSPPTTTTTTLPGPGQCDDSDGGKNPDKQGICFDSSNPDGLKDECWVKGDTKNKVKEWYCDNGNCAWEIETCDAGEVCLDGECTDQSGANQCRIICQNKGHTDGTCSEVKYGEQCKAPYDTHESTGDQYCTLDPYRTCCCRPTTPGGQDPDCAQACINLAQGYTGGSCTTVSGQQCTYPYPASGPSWSYLSGYCNGRHPNVNSYCCCTGQGTGQCITTDQSGAGKTASKCTANNIEQPNTCKSDGKTLVRYICSATGVCVALQDLDCTTVGTGYTCIDTPDGAYCGTMTGDCQETPSTEPLGIDMYTGTVCKDKTSTQPEECKNGVLTEYACEGSPQKCTSHTFTCPNGCAPSGDACMQVHAPMQISFQMDKTPATYKTCDTAKVTVTVIDSAAPTPNPLNGVLVTVQFTAPGTQTVSAQCTTDQEGKCHVSIFISEVNVDQLQVTLTATAKLTGYPDATKEFKYITLKARKLVFKANYPYVDPNPVQSQCTAYAVGCVVDEDGNVPDKNVAPGVPYMTTTYNGASYGSPTDGSCATLTIKPTECVKENKEFTVKFKAELRCFKPAEKEVKFTVEPIPLKIQPPTVNPTEIKSGASVTLKICVKAEVDATKCAYNDLKDKTGAANSEVTYKVTCDDGSTIDTGDGGKGKTAAESGGISCYTKTITPKVKKDATCTVEVSKASKDCHKDDTAKKTATFKVKVPICLDLCKSKGYSKAYCTDQDSCANQYKGTVISDANNCEGVIPPSKCCCVT